MLKYIFYMFELLSEVTVQVCGLSRVLGYDYSYSVGRIGLGLLVWFGLGQRK